MQDNNSTNRQDWDEQFVDHGWEKMRQLLDTEMPSAVPVEEPKKRRGLFFLLLVLLLGLGAALGWSLINQSATTPDEQIQTPPVATLEQQETATPSKEQNEDVSVSSISESALKKATIPATASSAASKQPQQSVTQSPKAAAPVATQQADNLALAEQVKSTSSNPVPPSTEMDATAVQQQTESDGTTLEEQTNTASIVSESKEGVESTATTTINQQQIPDNTNATITQLEILERLPSYPVSSTSPKPEVSVPTITEVVLEEPASNSKGKWTVGFAAMAGLQSNAFEKLNGHSVGIQLALQPKANARWALQTGLSYLQMHKNQTNEQKDLSYFNNQIGSSKEMTGIVMPDLSRYSNTQPEFLKSSLTELQYVALPVAARFAPIPKVQLHGGMSFAYLVNAKVYSVYQQQLNAGLSVSSYGVSESSVNSLPDENIPLQKWDVAGQAGVSYFPLQRIGVNLMYNYSLNSYIKTQDAVTKSYNRYWQFSVLYKFK